MSALFTLSKTNHRRFQLWNFDPNLCNCPLQDVASIVTCRQRSTWCPADSMCCLKFKLSLLMGRYLVSGRCWKIIIKKYVLTSRARCQVKQDIKQNSHKNFLLKVKNFFRHKVSQLTLFAIFPWGKKFLTEENKQDKKKCRKPGPHAKQKFIIF